MKKTIGIIGGMGPIATCDLLLKIIKYTDAGKDQEHVHVMLDNNTDIPDRTAAILGNGPNPIPEMVATGKRLEAAGADYLVMHCNTAHYFYDEVAAELNVPLIHIPGTTAHFLAEKGVKKVAVLATTGTRRTGIYEKVFSKEGIEVIYPNDADQEILMSIIYDYVKAGRSGWDNNAVQSMLEDVTKRGAEQIITGCTEVPAILRALPQYAALDEFEYGCGIIDPTVIIAKHLIELSGHSVK